MITELNKDNFNEKTRSGVKLIEFYTTWCGYCKKQQLELDQMDKVWIGQIDADKEYELAAKYNVNAFPTFLILKNGHLSEQFSGMYKKEALMEKIMKYLS